MESKIAPNFNSGVNNFVQLCRVSSIGAYWRAVMGGIRKNYPLSQPKRWGVVMITKMINGNKILGASLGEGGFIHLKRSNLKGK